MATEDTYISRFGRTCTACGFVRYWSAFSRSSADPTGFDDVCTDCKHTNPNQWYARKERRHEHRN